MPTFTACAACTGGAFSIKGVLIMFAAVDLGSNSFRLHIGHEAGGRMRVVRTARDPVRMAAGLGQDNMLSAEAIADAVRALRGFKDILDEYRLTDVRVVATNTFRVARNVATFKPLCEQAIGYPIEVISGEEEGRLIYMGVAHEVARPLEARLVIDIGGGSTELILGRGSDITEVESFGIGTQQQAMAFFTGGHIDARSFDAAITAARARFEDAAAMFRPGQWDAVYGSSGTIRAIGEVINVNGIGDGTMSFASLKALEAVLVRCGHVDRFLLPGIKRERVFVMLGGLSVLLGVMEELQAERIAAINAGLRLGALCDLELRSTRHDRRDQAIVAVLRRFRADEQRADRTAALARQLHAQLSPEGGPFRRYLDWASRLHEVGQSISHSGAHKHGAYMVENADIPGFTTGDQAVMAKLVLGQKGNLRKVKEQLEDLEFARAQLALRMAAMLMHARLDEHVGGIRLRMKSRIEAGVDADWARQHPTVMLWLEKEKESWAEVNMPMAVAVG
jgi:exopolyphosphatase/guanosine-5'-triphosphate,3'-diphosphate pyrophosphatase